MSPTDAALTNAIAAINIAGYAKTRNHLEGKVTRLSPYLTHGFISMPDLFEQLPKLTLNDKLAFEFGWREFFQHVWHRSGDAILRMCARLCRIFATAPRCPTIYAKVARVCP